jgi:hypothetical protein
MTVINRSNNIQESSMSAECLEAIETLCQWMDASNIDWDSLWPDEKKRLSA